MVPPYRFIHLSKSPFIHFFFSLTLYSCLGLVFYSKKIKKHFLFLVITTIWKQTYSHHPIHTGTVCSWNEFICSTWMNEWINPSSPPHGTSSFQRIVRVTSRATTKIHKNQVVKRQTSNWRHKELTFPSRIVPQIHQAIDNPRQNESSFLQARCYCHCIPSRCGAILCSDHETP